MRKIFVYILFCVLSLTYVCAETLVLRTGARVRGSIVFRNEEVVIIRDAEGARFQYPTTDIAEILTEETQNESDETINGQMVNDQMVNSKKASILIEVAGGAAIIPQYAAGGAYSADMLVGSHHIGERHLFIGGGLGYHGLIIGADSYNFLPVQVALRMPLIETKHAPVFGVSLGYGIALSKNYLGGIYTGLDFGYRCLMNPKVAISLVAFAQLQQATINLIETIDDNEYTHRTGRTFITPGLKLAMYF